MSTLPARVVLAILSFFLFFVSQVTRVNINIAIVVMEQKYFENGWDAKVITLGAFYWCYSLIELPGTFLLRKYGCRKILTISLLLAGLGNFLFPTAYLYHPICGIIIRAMQGLTLGITWPAVAVMSGKWIPIQERSKFTSTYQGSSVGTSFTNAAGGLIIYNLGWYSLFYLSGILCVIWTGFWWIYGFDSPSEHPRISESEKSYLESTIGKAINRKTNVPWKEMFKSMPFWAVVIGSFGIMWFAITISMQLPPFLHQVHKVNIQTIGFLLAIPDLLAFVFSLSYSILTDKLIKTKIMSITNARKFAFVFSHLLPAALLILMGFFGATNLSASMIFAVIAIAFGGATSSGNLANAVDISPNNAGIIMGMLKTLCIFPGLFSPVIVKNFTTNNHQNWSSVFLVTSIILVATCIFHWCFGSGEIQPWNAIANLEDEKIKNMEENKILLNNKNSIQLISVETTKITIYT